MSSKKKCQENLEKLNAEVRRQFTDAMKGFTTYLGETEVIEAEPGRTIERTPIHNNLQSWKPTNTLNLRCPGGYEYQYSADRGWYCPEHDTNRQTSK